MKPPKYDGTSAFETFYAVYHLFRLQSADKDRPARSPQRSVAERGRPNLVGLRPEVMDSYKELVRTLKGRFGGVNQWNNFRMEIRSRRRKNGESLHSLHSDVQRLLPWSFPTYNIQHEKPLSVTISLMH